MDATSFYGKKILRHRFLQSALEKAETIHSDDLDIVILPPQAAHNDSDEDEGTEEDCLDEDYLPTDVPGEIEIHHDELNNEAEEDMSDENSVSRWRKNESLTIPMHSNLPSLNGKMKEHLGKDPFEIYELFFTPEMVDYITEQTNLYANRDKNDPNFKICSDEMRNFLGLILVSGYYKLPYENDYWSTKRSLGAPIFPKTMCRDRFKRIKRYFHVDDNAELGNSKVAKVETLFNMLREQCQQFGVFDEFLSVDESMIPYKGLHSARQFMRSKPVRFGLKMWMLCGSTGYPYNFEIYTGKEANRKEPLGEYVVNKMLTAVSDVECHVLFFDNFFTSHRLIANLATKGIRACGTVRENRTDRCPLKPSKLIQKEERGSYDYRCDGNVLCVKWNDNRPVTIASNYYGVTPLHKAERYVKGEGRKRITQPDAIYKYNKGMGGVDVCDRKLSSYRPRLRTRKWWWNLFAHALNMSVVAAHEFYKRLNGQKISHHDFRIEIAESLLIMQRPSRKRSGGPLSGPPKAARFDGVNHILVSTNQGRCLICFKNTRLKCEKCEIRLHKSFCSETYHKK